MKAYSADAGETVAIVDKMLQARQDPHEGERHLEQTFDSFFIHRPKGRHLCRVLEPLGRTLAPVIADAYEKRTDLNTSPGWGIAVEGDGWSMRWAKKACWQILLGIDSLHTRRIAHRDIQPNNVCLDLPCDISSLSENEIQAAVWPEEKNKDQGRGSPPPAPKSDSDSGTEDESSLSEWRRKKLGPQWKEKLEKTRARERSIAQQWKALELDPGNTLAEPHSPEWNKANFLNTRGKYARCGIELLRRRDGGPLGDEPLALEQIHYTVSPTGLEDSEIRPEGDLRVVLIDLGLACPFEECEQRPAPGGIFEYLPPEFALQLPTTYKGDIFSLGLLFWEIVTLRRLVQARLHLDDPARIYATNRRLHDLAQRLGPIPSEMRAAWKEADAFVDVDGHALDKTMEWDELDEEYGPEEFEYGDISHQARLRKPTDASDHDMELFVEMVKEMCQWTPDLRPSTADLRKHPWFEELR